MQVLVSEVGPRDGLQSIKRAMPTEVKHRWIRALAEAGLREIEVASFVPPKLLPQMADAAEVVREALRIPGLTVLALVPNLRGMARAEATGADAIAVFTAATDAFTTANIGMTVAESLAAFEPVLARAGELGWWRRGYVSTAFGCPSRRASAK